MDRRSFLKGLAAVPVVAALPLNLLQRSAILDACPKATVAGIVDRSNGIADAILHTVRKAVHDGYSATGYISHETYIDIRTNKHYVRQTMANGEWSAWNEVAGV